MNVCTAEPPYEMACYVPRDETRIHEFCTITIPCTTRITNPRKAYQFFTNYLRMPGYVDGGPDYGKVRTFRWYFYVTPCLKTQMSPQFLVALETLERCGVIIINEKGRKYDKIVVSNRSYHCQVTGPVDMEIFNQWDRKCSWKQFLYERDTRLNGASLLFGSFEPEYVEPKPIEPDP